MTFKREGEQKMKHVSDTAQIPFFERIRDGSRLKENINTALFLNIGYALLGFLFANSTIFASSAPFGAAFYAACSRKYEISCAAGVILGSIVASSSDFGMKYIAAVLIIAAVKSLLRNSRFTQSDIVDSAITFIAVFSMSISLSIAKGASPYDVIMSTGESVMAAGAAYFFKKSISAMESYFTVRRIPSENIPCIAVSFAIAVLALSKLEIASVSIGRVAAVICILICANNKSNASGESAGAVCGITAGSVMGLVNSKYAFLTGSYGFGGMIAGVFSVFGRFTSVFSFWIVNAVAAAIFARDIPIAVPIIETAAGSVIFLLLPSDIFEDVFKTKVDDESRDISGARSLLFSRLSSASAAFKDIAATTQKVSKKLGVIDGENIESVYENTAVTVCSRCGSNVHCWQKKYTDTMNAFNDMTGIIKRDGKLSEEDIPVCLAQRCVKKRELADEFTKNYLNYSGKLGAQHRLCHIREVVTDQFEGLAAALDALSNEVSSVKSSDDNIRSAIIRLMDKYSVTAQSVTCFEDEYGRMTVEICLSKTQSEKITSKICSKIEEICEREFEKPQSIVCGSTVRTVLREKAVYCIASGAAQYCRDGERLCGDSFESFNDSMGNFHVILSDGMGSGGRAAVDSSMASNLLKRLIQAGIDYKASLRLVNSALLVKSEDESLATIDAAKIDLYTGYAEFLKAGAAPTFIKKSGKCTRIDAASMPAGILRSVEFEKSCVKLGEGDIIAMVSDGAVTSGDEWIMTEIELYGNLSAQEIAEKIAKTAKMRADKNEDDDITAIVVKLEKVKI